MALKDLAYVLETLNAMADAELALSVLYKACAVRFPAEKAIWELLACAEEKHTSFMIRMTGIVSSKHSIFTLNQSHDPTAIQNFVQSIKNTTSKIKTGMITDMDMLKAAVELEKSILEADYKEFLKSSDMEYSLCVKSITEETQAHAKLLAEAITKKLKRTSLNA